MPTFFSVWPAAYLAAFFGSRVGLAQYDVPLFNLDDMARTRKSEDPNKQMGDDLRCPRLHISMKISVACAAVGATYPASPEDVPMYH